MHCLAVDRVLGLLRKSVELGVDLIPEWLAEGFAVKPSLGNDALLLAKCRIEGFKLLAAIVQPDIAGVGRNQIPVDVRGGKSCDQSVIALLKFNTGSLGIRPRLLCKVRLGDHHVRPPILFPCMRFIGFVSRVMLNAKKRPCGRFADCAY